MWCVFSIILSVELCPQVLNSCRVAPQVQLNSQPLKEPLKPKAPSSLQRLHPTNKGSASTDRRMKELTSIHERTQFSQNIKLSEEGRLLLQPKRKRQIDPHFDIQFTDLKNQELDDASDSNEIERDSDDLPEAVLPTVGKEEVLPWTSSKVTKMNKMVKSDPVGGHPIKRIKTANSSAVSIRSYLY